MLTDQSAGRYAAKASKLLAVMANGKRMLVLELISNQEISVGQLAVMAGLSPSALSQHLAKLRGFKLVETRRDARTVFYRCDSNEVRLMLQTLHEIFGGALPPVSAVNVADTLRVPIKVPV
jgi:DNA-binding transcriptional ArsR family regulator